ncbi:hypothetical protein RFI_18462, partial [Reticulomyxa filosa]
ISTIISWFPDKPGFAVGLTTQKKKKKTHTKNVMNKFEGMASMGMGGGAFVAAPIVSRVMARNFKTPQMLDPALHDTITMDGKGQHFINGIQQVVQLHPGDLLTSGFSDHVVQSLQEGQWYLVGTGVFFLYQSGLKQRKRNKEEQEVRGRKVLFYLYVCAHFFIFFLFFFFLRCCLKKKSLRIGSTGKVTPQVAAAFTPEEAVRTPHFYLLWVCFFTCSTAGMGVLATAKTLISQSFATLLPSVVTSSFAVTYVMALSIANCSGRFGWGAISDKIGQFTTFTIFGLTGCALYATLPHWVNSMTENPSVFPLTIFYGSTLLLISFFGGNFSAMPAYEANLFGRKHVIDFIFYHLFFFLPLYI